MKLLHALIVLIVFLFTMPIKAQYTEIINTNRPGVSQGAFAVGTGVLQLETGASIGQQMHELLQTETKTLAFDYSLRYGLLTEALEINLMGSFQEHEITNLQAATPNTVTFRNFRSNTLGIKYLVFDPHRIKAKRGPNLYSWHANNRFQWRDLIPAVAVYGGLNFDFKDNPFTPEAETTLSPKFVLSTQHNWPGGFVLVANFVADRLGTDFPTYGYIVTVTHATHSHFSIFIENQGFKSDFYADQILRGGAAALITQDLHIDLSGSINFKDTPSLWAARLGVSYRLDMHTKDEYLDDSTKPNQ